MNTKKNIFWGLQLLLLYGMDAGILLYQSRHRNECSQDAESMTAKVLLCVILNAGTKFHSEPLSNRRGKKVAKVPHLVLSTLARVVQMHYYHTFESTGSSRVGSCFKSCS